MKVDSDNITVVESRDHVAVLWRPGQGLRPRGVVEASHFLEEGFWYVNRALVEPETARDQGHGTRMLQRLLDTIRRSGPARVVVDPGGYGSNTRRQRRFYRKAGFQLDRGIQGRMYLDLSGGVQPKPPARRRRADLVIARSKL